MTTRLIVAAVLVWGLSAARLASASIIFNLDPAQSSLGATGSINGDALSAQTIGSDQTKYGGTIEVDLMAGTIQFLGGNLTAGNFSSPLEPDVGAVSGSAPANYGHWVATTLFGYLPASGNSATRGLTLTLDSLDTGPLSLSTIDSATQGFNAHDVGTNINSGTVDWLLGTHSNTASLANKYSYDQNSAGTLTTADGLQTLTIPLIVNFLYTSYQTGDSSLRLSGTIVATHALPEPSTLAVLCLGALAAAFGRPSLRRTRGG